jgi:hypothetical protein
MNNGAAAKPLRHKAKYPENALKLTVHSSPDPRLSRNGALTRRLGAPKYRSRRWHSSMASAAMQQ